MKKIILSLIVIIGVLHSCIKDVDKGYLTTSNDAILASSEKEVFIFDTLYLRVNLNNKDCNETKKQKYNISYSFNDETTNQGIGKMIFRDKEFRPNEKLKYESIINNDVCYIKFVPNKVANIKLILTISNSYSEKEFPIDFISKDIEIDIDASITGNEANKVTPFVLNVENKIIKPTRSTSNKTEYPTKVIFTKNKGYVKFAKENQKQDTRTSQEEETDKNINKIYDGANDLLLYAEEIGATEIRFEITTPRGIEKKTLAFNTSTPSVSSLDVTIKQTTTEVELGQPYSFTADVSNSSPKDEFTISYRWIKGTENLTINSKELAMGEQVTTKSGIQTFILSPISAGERELELVFTDNYGQKVVETVLFTVTNNPFSVIIKEKEEKVILNENFSHNFTLNGNLTNDDYSMKYRFVKGAGTVNVNGEDMALGIFKKVTLGTNTLSITSTSLAENIIEFIYKDKFNQEIIKNFKFTTINKSSTVNPLEFSVSGVSLSDITINTSTSFYSHVSEKDYLGAFSGQYRFVKGSGSLKYKGAAVAVATPFVATTGNNIFEFTPTSLGEVELEITMSDEGGQSVTRSVKFKVNNIAPVVNPLIFSVSGVSTENITINTSTSFSSSITEKDYLGAFSGQYRFVKGSGSLKYKGAAVTVATPFVATTGNNTFEFTPTSLGEVELEITISDNNNQSVTRKVALTVKRVPPTIKPLQVNVTGVSETIYFGNSSSFNASVSEDDYLGSYGCSYRIISGVGKLSINGTEIQAGTKTTVNQGSNTFSVTPSEANNLSFELTFSDLNLQEVKRTISYSVVESTIEVTTSTPPSVNHSEPALFTFKANKVGYAKNFTVTYSIAQGRGVLKDGTKILTENSEFSIGNNVTNNFTFIPSKYQDNTLRFTIKDDLGNTTSKDVTISCVAKELTFNLTNISSQDILLGTSTSFTSTITCEGYIGSYSGSYRQVSGSGSLKYKGTAVTAGTPFTMTNGITSFEYTPTTTGTHKFEIVLSDQSGRTITKTVTYNVIESEIEITTSNPTTVDYNAASLFTLLANKDGYNSSFTVTYALTQGSGVFKSGGSVINENGTFTIQNNVTNNFTFNPTTYGDNKVRLTVKDSKGNTKSVTLTIHCTLYPIEVIKSNLPSSIVVGEGHHFNFDITEKKYTGAFRAKFAGSNVTLSASGTAMTQNVEYSVLTGNNTFVITPKTMSGSSITITLYDDNGQSTTETISYNVINTPLSLSSSSTGKELNLGESDTFTLLASQNSHTGSLSTRYTILSGGGTLKVGGGTVANNGSFNLTNGVTSSSIEFTPTEVGSTKIEFTTTGTGATKTVTLNYDVLAIKPILEISTGAITESKGGSSANLTLNAKTGDNVSSGKIKYEFISGSGKLSLGGQEMTSNAYANCTFSNLNFTFTPSTAVDAVVKFTVQLGDGREGSYEVKFIVKKIKINCIAQAYKTDGSIEYNVDGVLGDVLPLNSCTTLELKLTYEYRHMTYPYDNDIDNCQEFVSETYRPNSKLKTNLKYFNSDEETGTFTCNSHGYNYKYRTTYVEFIVTKPNQFFDFIFLYD